MLIPLSFCAAGVFFMNLIFMILLVLFNRASYYISNNTKTLSISIWVKILEILGFYELPSPTTSEMVSTIPCSIVRHVHGAATPLGKTLRHT